jgi:shikimate kinase
MNIVLIGYRGTGKSVISRILTDTLHCRRYSIDDEIVRQAGKPIPEIVEQEGWSKFREIERELVRKISTEIRSSVIDCGGGVVLDERNVADLKRDGKVILLVASSEKILERIHRDANRPPLIEGLSFEEEQRQILKERDPKYRAAADCIFDTTHLKPRQTAMKIIEHFKKKGWV